MKLERGFIPSNASVVGTAHLKFVSTVWLIKAVHIKDKILVRPNILDRNRTEKGGGARKKRYGG